MGRDHPVRCQPRFSWCDFLVRPHTGRYQKQRVCFRAHPPQDHAIPLRRDGRTGELHGRRRRCRDMEHVEPDARRGHQHILCLAIGQLERRERQRCWRVVRVLGGERADDVRVLAEWCGLGCVCVAEVVVSVPVR